MLDALRKGAGTWVAKIFIALLVLSFAVWGVADMFRGFGQNVAATVGETDITLQELDREYRRDLANFGQRIGRVVSTTEGAQFGIPQQTLGRLVSQTALDEAAREMKLGISDKQLVKLIQEDPSFKGLGNVYDRNKLTQVLRANGISEDDYVVSRRRLAERQQLIAAVAGNMAVPTPYLELANRYQGETRDVSYLLIDEGTTGEIADPGEETLAEYYETVKERFKAPEYREARMLELTPEKLARPEDVTDEEVSEEYNADVERYQEPEKRKVRQLAFPNKEEGEAAAKELAEGKTFDDLVTARNLSEKDISLGLMTKGDFLDEVVGDAAFALATGETSKLVEGRFTPVILNVEEIQPAKTRPLEEVKDEIRTQLAEEQAERELLDLLDSIEDARAGGETLSEIAQRLQLDLATPVALDRKGKDMEGADVTLPTKDALLEGIFNSDIDIENDPLPQGERGFLWYEVAKVIPSRERELAEVRADVMSAWKAEQLSEKIAEKSSEIADKLEAGQDIAALALESGLEVKTAKAVKRGEANGDLSSEAAALVFTGPKGTVQDATAATAPARLVLRVDTVNTPAFFAESEEMQALKGQLSRQMQNSLMGQYITQIQDKAGMKINQAAIARVIGAQAN